MKNGFIIFISISILQFLISFSVYASPPEAKLRKCIQDSDCVVVDGSFCGCAVAGARDQFAVNKKYKTEVEKQISSEHGKSRYGCIAGFSTEAVKKCANLNAVCLSNVCEVK